MLLLSMLGLGSGLSTAEIHIVSGSGSFRFVDGKGDPSKTFTVYTYLPKALKPDAARIVFVMHGHGKNAKGMRDTWIEHADKYGFMVISPLFDPAQWAGGDYSSGRVVSRDRKLRDPSQWSFSVIEHLFDAVKEATGNQSSDYFIYGHSEGGQFVHRLVLLLPDARYGKAIAANPGWYTMPRFDVKFSYGLGDSPASEASLKKSLKRNFILQLGNQDTDPNHAQLRKTPRAIAQGAHRFERGQNYMKEAQRRATELNFDIGWQIEVVAGAAHENKKMSRSAAALLMGH